MISQKSRGFTLVEVLISLVVVAVALASLIRAQSDSVRNLSFFQQKTLSDMVAANLLVEKRLRIQRSVFKKPLKPGVETGYYKLGQQEWVWRTNTVEIVKKNPKKKSKCHSTYIKFLKMDLEVFPNRQRLSDKLPSSRIINILLPRK